ncbi:MAG: dTDP-4-dehydrorhamnose reductase [Bacteroidota bacterium]|nr:dTDP-4-dehydrorhamnose reductase [Bacteroidota bacterium]
MSKTLVTGSHGQLGSELNFLSSMIEDHSFVFVDKDDLDITDQKAVIDFVLEGKFTVVINCAAYTAVDKAESEKEAAFTVNGTGAANLAKASKQINARFVHLSTDFIFDGTISRPILENDAPNPISVYGASKLEGEKQVFTANTEALVIRTSWVYSSFGNNFVKTILRLCRERESLNVIYDQVGTPTYARDLAAAILKIVSLQEWKPGIYNYSNEGVASWYDFALAIRDIAGLKTKITPIETTEYPTPAVRPKYSVLNKRKIKEAFGLEIAHWRDSLRDCVKLL